MSSFALSAVAIRGSVDGGMPVLQKRLFDRGDVRFPRKLLEVMEQLEQLGSVFAVFEILDGQAYVPGSSYYRITPDRLRNMIDARHWSLEEQRRIGELEAGED